MGSWTTSRAMELGKLSILVLLIASSYAQQQQPQFRQQNQEPQFQPPPQGGPPAQFNNFPVGQQRQFPQSAQPQNFPQSAQAQTQQNFLQPQQQPQQNFQDFAAFDSRQQQKEALPTLPPVFIPPNSPQGPPPQLQSPIRNLFRQPSENTFSFSNIISRFLNLFNLNNN